MKRDLKSMSKSQNRNVRPENGQPQRERQKKMTNQEPKFNAATEDDVRKKTEEFSKMSEGDLYSELFKNVDEAKKNGSFSQNDIEKFMKTVSPMLNKEQLEKMSSLINKIK